MGQVQTLIGRGIYDVDEIAHLTGVARRDIGRWASSPKHGGGLIFPSDHRLFTFWDLVTVRVVAMLVDQGVPVRNIREARDYLSDKIGVEWPMAHYAALDRIASVGRHVYVNDEDEWLDATLRGQLPLYDVVTPFLHRLEFEDRTLASAWRPRDGILLRPTVQAGAPCLEGTRLTTRTLAGMYSAGDSFEDIAWAYEIPLAEVRRAVNYEQALAS